MSRAITSVTISSIEDRRLTIGTAQAARLISVASTWTRMRIGVRLAFDDTGANVTGTPRFVLGLMNSPSSGVANGPLSATTSHFVGIRTRAGTWTRNTATLTNYSFTNAWEAFKRVGSTNTTANISGTNAFSATPASYRWPLIVDIIKGSPNYTVSATYWNGSVDAVDLTEVGLWDSFESELVAQTDAYLDTVLGVSNINTASNTIAVDEGVDGTLNAIVVGFDKATPLVHISDVIYKAN